MKRLTDKELIQLLPPDNDNLAAAISAFESVCPVNSYSKGFLEQAVKQGHYTPLQVNFEGVPALVLFYSETLDKGLWIHAAQTLNPYHSDLVFAAAHVLQQQKQLRYVRFMTIRAGMARVATKRHGYVVEGVVLSKR